MSDWSAAQYSKFKKERTIPAIDLANSIKCENVNSVLDIGCGIGNSTAVQQSKHPVHNILKSLSKSEKWKSFNPLV